MQFIDNLSASFSSLPPEQKKLFILMGAVGAGLLLVIVFAVSSVTQSSTHESARPGEIPEVTHTPEEIEALTMAPPKPTDIPFITKEDLIEHQPTPTPTPLPGQFYIANGLQNDLEIWYQHRNEGDSFNEIHVKNNKTTEERMIGYMYYHAPGNSAFFSKDFSQVVYLGGTKNEYNKLTFYSIPQNRIVKALTLDQMKKELPTLKTDTTSVLSRLFASPDKSKVALSYGNTFSTDRIVPDTSIIVINLTTNKMRLLPVKGLVKGWKDDATLEYEVNTTNPAINNTLEVTVNGI